MIAAPDEPGIRGWRLHRWLSGVLVVLVLAQAVVAGQATFGDWEIELHGWMGNGSFAIGVLLVGLAVVGRLGRRAVIAAGALSVALFVQVGLGYAGRTELAAASWHIPMGVTIFGLSVVNAMLPWLSSPEASGGPRSADRSGRGS